MKTISFFTALLLMFFTALAQLTPAQQLAVHQAQTMMDSLGLSLQQKDSLYRCNTQIFYKKNAVRQQYVGKKNDMASAMQLVEDSRDSMYQIILPIEKYKLYLTKKVSLLKP